MAPTYVIEIIVHSAHNLPVADLNTLSCDPYIHASLRPLSTPEPRLGEELSFRTPTVRRSREAEWCPSLQHSHCAACRDRAQASMADQRRNGEQGKPGDPKAPACGSSGRWVVGGVPRDGIVLKLHARDEDPRKNDDSLGHATITLSAEGLKAGMHGQKVEIKKRFAAPHVYVFTTLAAILPGVHVSRRAYLEVTVQVLKEMDDDGIGRMYTIGPSKWTQHFSPLIGAVTPARHAPGAQGDHGNLRPSVFIANKLQLAGPVPPELRHGFVGYAHFVTWMFKAQGIQGFILNLAARKQYRTIYSYDKNTRYGIVDGGPADVLPSALGRPEPGKGERRAAASTHSRALALRFLRMTGFGTGGRTFTYVITLDGEWRFTETGEEFAVDLLSKHTMHADVAQVIAFSGEFFVRRRVDKPGGGFESAVKVENGTIAQESKGGGDQDHDGDEGEGDRQDKGGGDKGAEAGPADGPDQGEGRTPPNEQSAEAASGGPAQEEVANKQDLDADADADDETIIEDPSQYELVIDNDSGTYRPKVSLLPVLRAWLADENHLCALGRITAVDGFDEALKEEKKARAAVRKKGKGVPSTEPMPKRRSSGVGKVVERVEEEQQKIMAAVGKDESKAKHKATSGRMVLPRRGSSVSSIGSGVLGPGRKGSVSSGEVERVLRDAQGHNPENDADLGQFKSG